jgi:hypothetical protein
MRRACKCDAIPNGHKNRYARFWRAAYLRMADCQLRQAALRKRFENFSLRSMQIRAHDRVRLRSGFVGSLKSPVMHRPASMKLQPDSQFTLPLDDSSAKVRPVATSNSSIASGVTEDNPQRHPTTQTIPAFYYRFDSLTARDHQTALPICPSARQKHPDQPLTRAEAWTPCASSLQRRS